MDDLSKYGLFSNQDSNNPFSMSSFCVSLDDGHFCNVRLDELPHVVNVLARFGFVCVVSSNSKDV